MTTIVSPPTDYGETDYDKFLIFLAGTTGEWRKAIINYFRPYPDYFVIVDPTNSQDYTWELNALEQVDVIVVFFEKVNIGAVSLMELGLSMQFTEIAVGCEPEFWAEKLIKDVTGFYDVPLFSSLSDLCEHIANMFTDFEMDRDLLNRSLT